MVTVLGSVVIPEIEVKGMVVFYVAHLEGYWHIRGIHKWGRMQ
jgi:hypothetical protein